jgi:sarcosine oxidase, subunit alpha
MHVLRAEKGFIIVGQETDGSVTPVDLGMNWIMGNKEFLGKRSLQREDCVKPDRKQLVGLRVRDGRTVLPEGGQIVEHADTRARPVPMLGHVTSSYWSATLGHPIALALVRGGHQRTGQIVYVAAGDRTPVAAEIVSPVFYDPEGARQNV